MFVPTTVTAEPAEDPVDASPDKPADESSPAYETLTVRGKVVWAADAQQRLFGIQSVPESAERLLCVEGSGEITPLVEDIRGRAFRRDKRLRNVPLEIYARRYHGSPLVQVIRVYEIGKDGQRYELDYWCEICAIAMFELKPCDCCQGDIELRRRPVTSKVSP